MYFWLNYCDGNHHIERILIDVKDIDHLFRLASEIIEADRLHLFLLSDDTRIDNNEYLSSLEYGTELIVCTEEQIQKLLIYFDLKRYLSTKNISDDALDIIDYRLFSMMLKITLIFIEAVISGTSLVLFKVFFNSLSLHMTLNKRQEFKTSEGQINQTFTTSDS